MTARLAEKGACTESHRRFQAVAASSHSRQRSEKISTGFPIRVRSKALGFNSSVRQASPTCSVFAAAAGELA